jgi:hypothetical protein
MRKAALTSIMACVLISQAAIAQITPAEGERRCKSTLDGQNRLCEGLPATGWHSRQACLDRNWDFYTRCMRNANLNNPNYVPPSRP